LRIAIVGAGLAGLSCAHELERLGFSPVIYEKRSRVGERFANVEVMAQFMHVHPLQDIFQYIRDELHLPLHPASYITRMVMHSHSQEASLAGRLGFTTIRGSDERALEQQLLRHVRSPIHFNQSPDVFELHREYDWVVVATGDQQWTREFLQWTPHITWTVRGAIVKGDYNPSALHFYFRTDYAKTGYAMIAPFDERTASVGVGVPHASAAEAEQFWQVFRKGEGQWWESEEEQFCLDHYEIGVTTAHLLGNVVLVGAAGGFVEGLGLAGQCPSLSSGVFAARQIALGDRALNRFARKWRTHYEQLWRIRRNVNHWTDREMDRMVYAASLLPPTALAQLPWSSVSPAAFSLNLLRRTDDHSPEVGLH
jgi:digeranylgeranylglycerophospholipid reductase